jgi:hypothetical protein
VDLREIHRNSPAEWTGGSGRLHHVANPRNKVYWLGELGETAAASDVAARRVHADILEGERLETHTASRRMGALRRHELGQLDVLLCELVAHEIIRELDDFRSVLFHATVDDVEEARHQLRVCHVLEVIWDVLFGGFAWACRFNDGAVFWTIGVCAASFALAGDAPDVSASSAGWASGHFLNSNL